MPIVIGEVITEIAAAPVDAEVAARANVSEEQLQSIIDLVARRVQERVHESLRREWDL